MLAARDAEGTLAEVLAAHRRLVPPPGGWRLVLADDGSVDGTLDVVRRAAATLPLVLVRQPSRGQNGVRNVALQHVQGDLLVLTDADAIPKPDGLGTCAARSSTIGCPPSSRRRRGSGCAPSGSGAGGFVSAPRARAARASSGAASRSGSSVTSSGGAARARGLAATRFERFAR